MDQRMISSAKLLLFFDIRKFSTYATKKISSQASLIISELQV